MELETAGTLLSARRLFGNDPNAYSCTCGRLVESMMKNIGTSYAQIFKEFKAW